MEGCFWKTLLLVGALSASGRCAPPHKPLTYEEAVEQGVANYNSKAEEDSLYRLLEAIPQPEWDPNSEGMQELKFTIKETVCPTGEEISLDKCDFKEDGVVRECTGDYFLGEKPPMAVLTCEAVGEMKEENGVETLKEKEDETKDQKEEEEEEDQDERSRKLKKFFRKVKKCFKKVFKKITFGVHVRF